MEMNFLSFLQSSIAMLAGVLPMVVGYVFVAFVLFIGIAAAVELIHLSRTRRRRSQSVLNLTGRKFSNHAKRG